MRTSRSKVQVDDSGTTSSRVAHGRHSFSEAMAIAAPESYDCQRQKLPSHAKSRSLTKRRSPLDRSALQCIRLGVKKNSHGVAPCRDAAPMSVSVTIGNHASPLSEAIVRNPSTQGMRTNEKDSGRSILHHLPAARRVSYSVLAGSRP